MLGVTRFCGLLSSIYRLILYKPELLLRFSIPLEALPFSIYHLSIYAAA